MIIASFVTEGADFVIEDFLSQPIYVIIRGGNERLIILKDSTPMVNSEPICLELVARHWPGHALWRRFELYVSSPVQTVWVLLCLLYWPS